MKPSVDAPENEPSRPSSHRGAIPDDGVVSLLRDLEDSRVSGRLSYVGAGGEQGEVWLRLGQIDPGQPEQADGVDPVERFLALRGGTFEVTESLPPLDDSIGGATQREGRLERHAVPDLMNYAEAAGLSGLLRVEHEGRVAEIVYEEGALVAIYLDGSTDDVDAIFGWNHGRFAVRMKAIPSLLPPAPAPGTNEDRPQPRIVERALGELLDEAEHRRPRPLSVIPPRSLPPPRRESTVRIVLLGGSGEALFSSRSLLPAATERSAPPTEAHRPVLLEPEAAPSSLDAVRLSAPRGDGRRSASRVDLITEPRPRSMVPAWAKVLLVLLLVLGLGGFVASLLSIG